MEAKAEVAETATALVAAVEARAAEAEAALSAAREEQAAAKAEAAEAVTAAVADTAAANERAEIAEVRLRAQVGRPLPALLTVLTCYPPRRRAHGWLTIDGDQFRSRLIRRRR